MFRRGQVVIELFENKIPAFRNKHRNHGKNQGSLHYRTAHSNAFLYVAIRYLVAMLSIDCLTSTLSRQHIAGCCHKFALILLSGDFLLPALLLRCTLCRIAILNK